MVEILFILTIKIAANSGLLIGDLDKSQHNFALPSGREKFGTIEAGTEKMHRNNLRNYCMPLFNVYFSQDTVQQYGLCRSKNRLQK